jgi:anti-sigma B factor antagonist
VELIAADPRTDAEAWFSLVLVPSPGEVRLAAIGELDLAAVPTLRERVGGLLAAGFDQLVVDLRQVTFIDLAGVRLLLKLARDADDDGWRLSLIEVGGQVRQILTLTGVLDQLPIRNSPGDR